MTRAMKSVGIMQLEHHGYEKKAVARDKAKIWM